VRWYLFKKREQERRTMKEVAEEHYRQLLISKHFYNMIDSYQGEKEDRDIMNKAKFVSHLKTKRKVMKGLALNVLKERKYKQAEMLYRFKLAE
jgi:hypothetical protein